MPTIVNIGIQIPYYSQRVSVEHSSVLGFASDKEAEYWIHRGCGIACLRMVIDGFRAEQGLPPGPNQGTLIRKGLAQGAYNGRGWIYAGLVQLASEFDISGRTFRRASREDILGEISQGRPCIASVTVGFEGGQKDEQGAIRPPGGHLVVVTGYAIESGQPVGFLVNHPSSDPNLEWEERIVPLRDFERSFSGGLISFWQKPAREASAHQMR